MGKPLELSPHAQPQSNLNKPKKKTSGKNSVNNVSHDNKILHNITDNDAFASIVTDPMLFHTPFREKNLNEEFINLLCAKIVDFFLMDPKRPVRPEQFFLMHNYSRMKVWRLKQEWPQFKETLETIDDIIATRRDIGALLGLYNPAHVKFTLPVYDERLREEGDRQIKLRNEVNQPQDINIIHSEQTCERKHEDNE